ncbi:hypothetical protein DE146DRAFT_375864 [Phaeosphaeria sp. MPI-PUGE-AT-0046c]|nr:hypothetical protein DE146DRAFT_375864 [Phaeosphaeria sp. MPI-PUGE-AT-0046c]
MRVVVAIGLNSGCYAFKTSTSIHWQSFLGRRSGQQHDSDKLLSLWSSWFHRDVKDLHRIYGDIFRVAPSELSFARVDAYNDKFTNTQGRPALPKSKLWHYTPPEWPISVFHALDPRMHARIRMAVNPAFSLYSKGLASTGASDTEARRTLHFQA